MTYPIGIKVRISRSSKFADQHEGIGEIYANGKTIDGTIWHDVRFPNEYENSYRSIDLELVPEDNESALCLLPKCEWEELQWESISMLT